MVVLMLFGSAVLFVLIAFLLYTAYIAYVHHKYSHIPSPRLPSFYFGHISDIKRLRKEAGNPYLPLQNVVEYWMQQASSSVVVVFFFHKANVFVADPEVIKAIVMDVKNNKPELFSNFFFYCYGERFLGNGLTTVPDYETWKPKRMIYESSFHKRYLKDLVMEFNPIVDDFLDKLKPVANGKTVVGIADHFNAFTMDVVSRVVFGTDFTSLWDEKSLKIDLPSHAANPFAYIVTKAFTGSSHAVTSAVPQLLQYLHPLEAKGYQEAVRAMRRIGRDCIQRRIEALDAGKEIPKDVLSNILQSSSLKETHSIEDLVDDFCAFYTAGHETTSNLLSFAIIRIYQHPNVLASVLEEVKEVLGDRTTVTAEDLDKLVYMEQVLHETLRLNPIVAGILKTIATGQTLGGYYYPANTVFYLMSSVFSPLADHYFDNPSVFNPDRFNSENKRPDSFALFPFGVGHRKCIGKGFALMEAKMLLSRLLQTYTIHLPEDYELVPISKITSQPKDNIPCVITLN